ncbi:MAG: dTDP-4-amino-4,6-dideoxygalactose transaminase [Bacteroidales bacterium]|nr:dTDP-4-amino-4,6-dideoxygalactose transaminase [Bacteroidales bacterium]
MKIPFNRPYYTGREAHHMTRASLTGKLSGNGLYTKKCHELLEEKYGFKKTLLTHSCTAALEMAAILAGIEPGDEVIMPSFTFVSTANAFILRGARIIFADTAKEYPNIDVNSIKKLITDRTKAVVVIHYAGVACDMDRLMILAGEYNFFVIEDAAHAIDSYYKNKPLGSIGHFGAFSFHETKNIISGEGGMLAINDEQFIKRAEIIWEKGTNRVAFSKGEINKYGWVDIGSSFLPAEIISSFLYAQLENIDDIQQKRSNIWNSYFNMLKPIASTGVLELPTIPSYAHNNANMFFIITQNRKTRDALLMHLKNKGILAVFHYIPLHSSEYYRNRHDGRDLPNTDRFSDCIVRLPFYTDLAEEDIALVVQSVREFFAVR